MHYYIIDVGLWLLGIHLLPDVVGAAFPVTLSGPVSQLTLHV